MGLQTHTMLGTEEQIGLIPRAAEQLFLDAHALEASQGWTFEIKVGHDSLSPVNCFVGALCPGKIRALFPCHLHGSCIQAEQAHDNVSTCLGMWKPGPYEISYVLPRRQCWRYTTRRSGTCWARGPPQVLPRAAPLCTRLTPSLSLPCPALHTFSRSDAPTLKSTTEPCNSFYEDLPIRLHYEGEGHSGAQNQPAVR